MRKPSRSQSASREGNDLTDWPTLDTIQCHVAIGKWNQKRWNVLWTRTKVKWKTTPADISWMEQAAVHRMAKSIAQLRLYQITIEDWNCHQTFRKKRATSSGASQKFRPSGSLILKSVKHRKLSEVQKALLFCPVLKKDLARLKDPLWCWR